MNWAKKYMITFVFMLKFNYLFYCLIDVISIKHLLIYVQIYFPHNYTKHLSKLHVTCSMKFIYTLFCFIFFNKASYKAMYFGQKTLSLRWVMSGHFYGFSFLVPYDISKFINVTCSMKFFLHNFIVVFDLVKLISNVFRFIAQMSNVANGPL